MAATKTLEERKKDFIERLERLYPDYKLVSDYVNGDTFILLEHISGVVWKTKPRYLDGKRQCSEVNFVQRKVSGKSNKKLTHEDFLEKFFSKYSKEDYEVLSEYKNQTTMMTFKHKLCGKEFEMLPKDILYSRSKGCPYCYTKKKRTVQSTNEEFQLREDLKDYECLSTFAKDGHAYGEIVHHCELCNDARFIIRLTDMFSSHEHRCPVCKNLTNESKNVRKIKKYLEENDIEFIQEKYYDTCKDKGLLPFDFYLPEYDLLIEYDGRQHFFPVIPWGGNDYLERVQLHDKIKDDWCKDNNKDLLRINYMQDEIETLDKYLKENYEITYD